MTVSRAVNWIIAGCALGLVVASFALLVISWSVPAPDRSFSFRGTNALNAIAFTVVGLIIVTRRSGNLIGRLLIYGGLASAVYGFAAEYSIWGIGAGHDPERGTLAAWVVEWIWVPLVGLYAPVLLMTFPTGQLPSARWRAAVSGAAVVTALGLIATALRPGELRYSFSVPNPFARPDLGDAVALAQALSGPLSVLVLLAGIVALVARFRSGTREVRLQIKWFALAGAVSALTYALAIAFPGIALFERGVTLSGLAMPAAIGVAVLRYRLYDVDRLIDRAIVYGAVSAISVATYVSLVVISQAALRPFTTGNELAVAASTLLVVALFQPIRRRVQDIVDRRFYRARYDAARTLDAFSGRLRNEVELESVRSDLLGVVEQTVRPAHASLWLR